MLLENWIRIQKYSEPGSDSAKFIAPSPARCTKGNLSKMLNFFNIHKIQIFCSFAYQGCQKKILNENILLF